MVRIYLLSEHRRPGDEQSGVDAKAYSSDSTTRIIEKSLEDISIRKTTLGFWLQEVQSHMEKVLVAAQPWEDLYEDLSIIAETWGVEIGDVEARRTGVKETIGDALGAIV